MAATRPDYVLNFTKPPGTEIKHISGHWYLYERQTKYDPVTKRSRRVGGTYLGAITENGFVPKSGGSNAGSTQGGTPSTGSNPSKIDTDGSSTAGASTPLPEEAAFPNYSSDKKAYTVEELKARGCYTPTVADASLSNTVEAGAVNFLYHITERIREVLKRFFSDCWATIYTIAMLRVIYGSRFSKLEYHYRCSELSHIYPGINLNKDRLTEFNRYLGLNREAISNCMRELGKGAKQYLLVDGHRIISYSKTMSNAKKGYDSRRRNQKQINLMYLVSKDDYGIGHPSYYKQYKGSCPDVSAINDLVKEVKDDFDDIVIVGDKGTENEKVCDDIVKANLNYVFALKRGSKDVAEAINDSRTNFGPGFIYHRRAIQYLVINKGDHKKIVYLDYRLLYEEMSSSLRLNIKKIQENIKSAEKTVKKLENKLKKAEKAQERFEKQIEKKKLAITKLEDVINKAEVRAKEAEARAETLSGKQTKQAENALTTATKRRKYVDKLKMDLEERSTAVNVAVKKKESAIEEAAFLKTSIEDAKVQLSQLQGQAETLENEALDNEALQQSTNSQASGVPAQVEPIKTPSLETGTFTVVTSLTDKSPEYIYLIYKQRPAIEQFFKLYDTTLGLSSSYMRDTYTEEAWLFLNHISALMTVLAMELLKLAEKSNNTSVRDLINLLASVRAVMQDDDFQYEPIEVAVRQLCTDLDFDPTETPIPE